ncbi:hypothetical protein Vretifemale_20134 [Volvox reticuliferus]|uniref:Tyr recombinase domain-containing protein n=1 Tax=Volvox reticuliferus TaxID=1737510 RepID=A0A8J4G1D1_9CHLO|nr:hypothetical protein Vretifemale_20134 [Volvox reticuliferus]
MAGVCSAGVLQGRVENTPDTSWTMLIGCIVFCPARPELSTAGAWRWATMAIDPQDAELLVETRRMVGGSRAVSSLGQYQGPWEQFVQFCGGRQYAPLPASPLVVAMFLTDVAKRAQSYAVVKTASAAIFTHHELAGVVDPPTKHVWCKGVRAAAKRQLGVAVKNRKEPLGLETVQAIVELQLCGAPRLLEVMVATYVMVCFTGFLRYDEVQRLLVKDVQLYDDRAEVFLSKRKNDQFREGNVIVLAAGTSEAYPVRLLRRFLQEAAWGSEMPLFRDWNGHQARRQGAPIIFSTAPVSYEKMQCVVLKLVGKVLGLPETTVKARFGLHSLRSGGATMVAAAGVEERLFQAHGGWRSQEAMLPYVKETSRVRLGVTKALGY